MDGSPFRPTGRTATSPGFSLLRMVKIPAASDVARRLNGVRQRVRKCRLQSDVVGADPFRHRKRQRRFATKRMRRVVADEVKFQRPESAACQHGPRRR